MRTILPFYSALLAALFLVTYIPGFSMWLPHLLELTEARSRFRW